MDEVKIKSMSELKHVSSIRKLNRLQLVLITFEARGCVFCRLIPEKVAVQLHLKKKLRCCLKPINVCVLNPSLSLDFSWYSSALSREILNRDTRPGDCLSHSVMKGMI